MIHFVALYRAIDCLRLVMFGSSSSRRTLFCKRSRRRSYLCHHLSNLHCLFCQFERLWRFNRFPCWLLTVDSLDDFLSLSRTTFTLLPMSCFVKRGQENRISVGTLVTQVGIIIILRHRPSSVKRSYSFHWSWLFLETRLKVMMSYWGSKPVYWFDMTSVQDSLIVESSLAIKSTRKTFNSNSFVEILLLSWGWGDKRIS